MEENPPPHRASSQTAFDIRQGLRWGRAIIASIIATAVMTGTMALFGLNIMKDLGDIIMLGTKFMGTGAGQLSHYLVGGAFHLVIGIFYGVIYAGLISPLGASQILKGVLYGTVLSVIAVLGLPVLTNLAFSNADLPQAEVSTDIPLTEEEMASVDAAEEVGENVDSIESNSPTEAVAEAPLPSEDLVEPEMAAQDGGNGIVKTSVISWINHVIYALVVAIVYRRKGILNT